MEKARKNIRSNRLDFNPIVSATGGAVLGGLFGGVGTFIGLAIGFIIGIGLNNHIFSRK